MFSSAAPRSLMASAEDGQTKVVGPYLLQRTLGKGQTGLVKMGVHCVTRKTVAVKMITRQKLSHSVLMKVEREIAIMKLINHPHVLGLYDVYENNTHLYLVLEHVSGGELFDYLVRKGRLSEREARRFFRQIISAVDFCHKHKVCHRDLKPENLLLDESKNIKVADFGMASLQVGTKLLETSCGSPHYACPEVIRGEQYDGRKADVWSCGVILFALLVGALPFDDDNLRVLLEKVKKGHFQIPSYIAPGAQELLKGMVEVNPRKRLTFDSVMKHPWFRGSHDQLLDPSPVVPDSLELFSLTSRDEVDPDVIKSMTSLGCFKDKTALLQALLSPDQNEEKVVYCLLLSRKERQPSIEDEARALAGPESLDPPRKRIDSKAASSPQLAMQRARAQSIGSANLDQLPAPRSPRLSTIAMPTYNPSSTGYYTYTGSSSPGAKSRKVSSGEGAAPPGSPWKRKLSQTMKSLVVSPRFQRKRYEAGSVDNVAEGSQSPPSPKRSWFANFRSEREKDEVVQVFRDKSFQELKASILVAFTAVNCQYEDVSENIFRVKYEKSARHKSKSVFQKTVKLTLTVIPTQTSGSSEHNEPSILFDGKTFTVTFSQISGPTRRFRRVCEKLQAAIVSPAAVNPLSLLEECDNPSLSSDDTLALHSTSSGPSPLLTEGSEVNGRTLLDSEEETS